MSRLNQINRLRLAELNQFNWDEAARGGVRALFRSIIAEMDQARTRPALLARMGR